MSFHLLPRGMLRPSCFVLQGISDAPSWIVTRANQYARDHGKTPFCIYQGMWSVIHRDLERDIIPMVKSEGMALAPFNVLASGKIRSDEQERQRRETGEKGECKMIPIMASINRLLSDHRTDTHVCQLGAYRGRAESRQGP